MDNKTLNTHAPLPAMLLLLFLLAGCLASQSNLARGKHYLENRNYDQAVKALEKAANEQGDIYYYIDTYTSLGDAYAMRGEQARAQGTYRNGLQIIHLRLREIAAERREIRKELNRTSSGNTQNLQDQDIALADEEWRLNEQEEGLKRKVEKSRSMEDQK
ncbi:MAG: hypothetical protein JSU90_05015 [Nitrospiraceae bacterium]|nr:MAG: hypothetical protein JSU90_05015 [Nitrospiraceae bacterium]